MKILLTLLLLLSSVAVAAQTPTSKDSLSKVFRSRQYRIPERRFAIIDTKTPRSEVGQILLRIEDHPGLDSLLIRNPEKECEILAEINRRCDALGKDSLCTSELFWVQRPYFDWLHHEDPHYRIYMRAHVDRTIFTKRAQATKMGRKLRMPAFNLLRINDTLIVNRSLDAQFQRGDMLVAINGVSVPEYLKYSYNDRQLSLASLMHNYHFSQVVDTFRIRLLRGGVSMEIETPGELWEKPSYLLDKAEELDQNIRTYADARCGYIAIPAFFYNNKHTINVVRKAILSFKKQGITNVILDLRRNPGGNGHAFDKLLSIFIQKLEVEYCTAQRVKVSKTALEDYPSLSEEQLGQVVALPDTEITRSFKTDPKMFIDGMTYHVLVSRDTGSIAASFVNMLQYHGAAQLVGEPLAHNALKYGEVMQGRALLPTQLAESAVSMVEIDECTRAVDGVVTPDIPIADVAADYLTGGDATLDKLLDHIRHNP